MREKEHFISHWIFKSCKFEPKIMAPIFLATFVKFYTFLIIKQMRLKIGHNYLKPIFLRITGVPVITWKNKKIHHYKFGQDSDAKNLMSLSSLVLSEQTPLKWTSCKKNDLASGWMQKTVLRYLIRFVCGGTVQFVPPKNEMMSLFGFIRMFPLKILHL